MKLLLSGYEGSKKILPASSFLVNEYLGTSFDVFWLNYGEYDGLLFSGEFVSLADKQENVATWARDIRNYLATLSDPHVIFGLDDYLVSGPIDLQGYYDLLDRVNGNTVCARLCRSDFYQPHEHEREGEFVKLTPKAEYSVTTQYSIWQTQALMEILAQVKTPWSFETDGSWALNHSGKQTIGRLQAVVPYPEQSALSNRWPGKVNVRGNPLEDVEALVERGLLELKDLLS